MKPIIALSLAATLLGTSAMAQDTARIWNQDLRWVDASWQDFRSSVEETVSGWADAVEDWDARNNVSYENDDDEDDYDDDDDYDDRDDYEDDGDDDDSGYEGDDGADDDGDDD